MALIFICFYAIESTLSPYGDVNSLWVSGSILYASVVIVANIKIFNSFYLYTYWGEILIIASITIYFI
jgi:hypothetical protein